MKKTKIKIISVLLFCMALLFLTPAGTAGVLESFAATQLRAPKPYLRDTYSVTWERVNNAGSYEVKLSLLNESDGKTVTRTFKTTANRHDLTLFAAGCSVSVSVRAIPTTAKKKEFSTSAWGECDDTVEPSEDNETFGYAGISGSRYFLADESGQKLSGWQKVNRFWYYFDPSNGNLSAIGWTTVNGKNYYFSDTGKMQTGWLSFEHHWYFLNGADGHMVTGWHQVTPNKSYYFTETADSSHPRGSLNQEVTHASFPNNDPPYRLETGTSGTFSPSGTASETKWISNPGGSWSYMKNGKKVKSAWENIDGFWYYFDANELMLTGWQYINSRWYYLEPHPNGSGGYKYGAMWKNATTPDGYTVNADGMWVKNGAVVTERGSNAVSTNSTGDKLITSCRITVSATDTAAGKCRKASVSGATNCTVTGQSFSRPWEKWAPGDPVTVTVTLQANSGYKFGSGTAFSGSGATVVGQSGSTDTRTVTLNYIPVVRLKAPQLVYITEENELRWFPVKYGARYKLQVTGGDSESTVTRTVSGTRIDLWEFGDVDAGTMKVTLSALGPEGNKYFLESEKVVINDTAVYKETHRISGTLEVRDGKLRYTDDSGAAVTGWQQLCGGWYHFKSTGYADGPGWYQDGNGYWYYFGEDYRMVTGTVTENGKTYFLNDGSRPNVPQGAWVQ